MLGWSHVLQLRPGFGEIVTTCSWDFPQESLDAGGGHGGARKRYFTGTQPKLSSPYLSLSIIYIYIYVLYTYMHTCIPAYLHTCIPAYMYTHTHEHINTNLPWSQVPLLWVDPSSNTPLSGSKCQVEIWMRLVHLAEASAG